MTGKSRLLVLAGPTASGKTACAVELALRLNGEIVSADSMQVYRDMPILSAAPTHAEMRGVPHHMIGIASPRQKFSAASYREGAFQAIEAIEARGRLPILCGGTGLYMNAVTRPLSFSAQGDETLRCELQAIAAAPGGRERLHAMLAEIDPASAARLHPNDVRRVSRAIEIYRLTGRTQSEQAALDAAQEGPFDERLFALLWPREALYHRIEQRVDAMLEEGLVDEVRALMSDADAQTTARQAIGYKEIAAALRGEMTMDAAILLLKQATRNYAKRQMTWFRRDPRVEWIEAEGRSAGDIAGEIAEKTKVWSSD